MTKEHKKLYKAGKNWIVATLTATTITLLGGIGAYTIHADTTIESSQGVQTTSVNQTNQVDNSNDSVTINQPVAVQSSQTAQNDLSVQGNQTNQIVPSSASAAADTSNSDSLDSNIYGTVNVKDWDYQNDSNTFNLTSYHGQDTRHIIVPNLNDFDNAGVKIGNATGVGISSKLAKSLASQSLAFAISKTSGKYSDKVTATDNDWSSVFNRTYLINADVSNLDTRNITDMAFLFTDSTGLKTVGNLSHWNVSNVRNMSWMFHGCNGVIGDLSHWNVSNVRDMSGMFSDYNGVIGDLSHWNVSNVRDMSWMFDDSSASVSGLNTWNIRQTTDMSLMFCNSSLPYKIVAANEESIIPNQVTLKDNTGKILAIIDTPTIYDSNKSVRSTIDGIVQAEIDKLNKLNHTSYETPKIISVGDDDYSIANATYVVNTESQSKTGLINYVDQDGKVVKADQVSGKVGDKVNVKLSLPDGYELANKDEQVPSTITVGNDGIKTININIKKIPVTKTGTINYIDPDGKVVKTDQVSGKVGDKVDVKLSLPDGYELANKDEQVPSTITVGDDGIKTININIKKIPVTKTGTINYIDPDGKVVKTDQVSGKVGDKVNVKLSLPDGYELANKDEQVPSTITVGDNGIKTININIKKIPVIKTGTINYIDPDGKVVKTDQVSGKVGDKVNVKLSLPDGYELANKDEQVPSTITVGNDGIKTININIKKIPVIKTGTINYIDPDGKVVKTDQVSGKVGDKVDVKLSLPDGYELANKDEQVPSTITVGDDGIKTININIKKINTTPTTPVNPTEPNNPTTPVNPTTPANPTEPINPSTPSDTHNNNHGTTPATPMAPTAKGNPGANQPSDNNVTGWRNSSDGNHYVYYKDNQPLAGRRYVSLPTINGVGTSWYLVDNGVVQSGVQKWAGTYYYFDPVTYLKVTNDYRQSQWGDWYLFGNDGRILTGVQKWAGSYYYFDPVTYLKVTNDYRQSQWGDWYLFGNDGRILTGVQKWAGSYYYFDPVTYLKVTNDYRQSQWGSWYLFGNDGRILTGVQKWAGSYYYFDPVTYLKVTNSYRQSQWGDWYMFGPDGRIVSGLYNWLGNLYYFDPVTYLKVTNQYVYVGGVRYWADANGCLSRA